MSKLLYLLLALIVLLVLITVHEFGHYCAGKMFGFKINEFSIGFGPAIFKRTKKDGEIFSIRALPLGGYCAFEGEDEDGKDNPNSFNSKTGWKRIIVLLAGVTFNFLFGILTAVVYLLATGYSTVQITATINQSTVQTMGFEKNDIVIAVDGKHVEAYRSFSSMISKFNEGEEFLVTVDREGTIIDIKTKKQKFNPFYYVTYSDYFKGNLYKKNEFGVGVPITIEDFNEGIIACDTTTETDESIGKGSALQAYLSTIYKDSDCIVSYAEEIEKLITGDEASSGYAYISYSNSSVGIGIIQQYIAKNYGFFESLVKAWPFCFYLCGLILSALAGLFTGTVSVSEAGGTITAISQIAEISEMGISYFLLLLPMLSMNLALFNVLPIPSLDGARVVFVLIEIIFRKPVPRQIEGWIHTVGLFVLLALVVFLDFNHFFLSSIILQL